MLNVNNTALGRNAFMQNQASFIYKPAAVNHCANYSIEGQGAAAENRVKFKYPYRREKSGHTVGCTPDRWHNQFRHLVRILYR